MDVTTFETKRAQLDTKHNAHIVNVNSVGNVVFGRLRENGCASLCISPTRHPRQRCAAGMRPPQLFMAASARPDPAPRHSRHRLHRERHQRTHMRHADEHAGRKLCIVSICCLPVLLGNKHGGHSSVGRASDCGSEGRGFEPRWPPQCPSAYCAEGFCFSQQAYVFPRLRVFS